MPRSPRLMPVVLACPLRSNVSILVPDYCSTVSYQYSIILVTLHRAGQDDFAYCCTLLLCYRRQGWWQAVTFVPCSIHDRNTIKQIQRQRKYVQKTPTHVAFYTTCILWKSPSMPVMLSLSWSDSDDAVPWDSVGDTETPPPFLSSPMSFSWSTIISPL